VTAVATDRTPADAPTRRARREQQQHAAARPRAGTRAARRAQRLLLDLAAVVGVLSLLAVAACLALGVRPAVVVSGSMAPGIPVGAVTLARTVPAESVAVGDVVTVPRTDGRGLVTHRVIETAPGTGGATTLRLQGDANTEPDALPYTVTEVGQVPGARCAAVTGACSDPLTVRVRHRQDPGAAAPSRGREPERRAGRRPVDGAHRPGDEPVEQPRDQHRRDAGTRRRAGAVAGSRRPPARSRWPPAQRVTRRRWPSRARRSPRAARPRPACRWSP
jgi:signal peptidase I